MAEVSTAAGPSVGDVVAGRYRIDEVLGAGGMGTVYRATQLGLQRAVALKVIHPERAADPQHKARFAREARVMAALDHPNAVKIFDYGMEPTYNWLVMELLVGEPLSHHLARGTLDEATAAGIGATVCDVLVATHALRMVHRDLKPDNLFVIDGGDGLISPERIRVVDFGIAFIEDAGDMGRLTQKNIVVGTPRYVSPEYAAGRSLGPPADLYALGIILFEMVAGAPPFLGEAGELLAKQIYVAAPSVASVRQAPVDPRYEEIVAWLLKKNPEARPSAEETRARLREIAGNDAQVADPTRAARMMPAGRATPRQLRGTELFMPEPAAARPLLALRTQVALADEVRVALAAAGVTVVDVSQPGDALLLDARTADFAERLRDAKGAGAVVLAVVAAGDLEAVASLVRQGVEDVVSAPLDPPALARKVSRAVRGRVPRAGEPG